MAHSDEFYVYYFNRRIATRALLALHLVEFAVPVDALRTVLSQRCPELAPTEGPYREVALGQSMPADCGCHGSSPMDIWRIRVSPVEDVWLRRTGGHHKRSRVDGPTKGSVLWAVWKTEGGGDAAPSTQGTELVLSIEGSSPRPDGSRTYSYGKETFDKYTIQLTRAGDVVVTLTTVDEEQPDKGSDSN